MKWEDLSTPVKKKVNQMLTRGDRSSQTPDFRDLGQELGLDHSSELKVCTDAQEVFESLATRKVPPDMELILQKLRNLKRFDVMRKIVDDILEHKSS